MLDGADVPALLVGELAEQLGEAGAGKVVQVQLVEPLREALAVEKGLQQVRLGQLLLAELDFLIQGLQLCLEPGVGGSAREEGLDGLPHQSGAEVALERLLKLLENLLDLGRQIQEPQVLELLVHGAGIGATH